MHTQGIYLFSIINNLKNIHSFKTKFKRRKKSHPKQNNIHQQQHEHEQVHVVSTPATKQSMAAFLKETVKASLKNCDISVFI